MAEDRSVTSTDYPYLPIRLEVRGVRFEDRALLDTGFTGELIIPETALNQGIGQPIDHSDMRLGDDIPRNVPWYLGTLEIVGLRGDFPGTFIQVIGNEYNMGRGILDLFEVAFDHGQRIIVRP